MEKNLSQILGKSFKISETCKSVTRLDCFRTNSGTVKILSIFKTPMKPVCRSEATVTTGHGTTVPNWERSILRLYIVTLLI